MNAKIAWLGALAFAVVAGVAIAQNPPWASDDPTDNRYADEVRYAVTLDEWRQEFRENGTVTLLAPRVGWITVQGEQQNWTVPERDGGEPLPHIAIRGDVVGYPGSDANIMIGEYAVYGTVKLPIDGEVVSIDFDAAPTGEDETFEQRAYIRS